MGWAIVVAAISFTAFALSVYTFVHDTYPLLVKEHRLRQAARLRYDGWTLPTILCWLYWFEAEHRAPHPWRRFRPLPPESACQ
jgi:hypothetical protein